MGPSGSGKTTFLYLISGLEKPTKGAIFFNNQDITKLNERELADFRLRNIGFVFQNYNLIPVLTALENVELPAIAAGILNEEEIRRKAIKIMETVGLRERLYNRPAELSGGEQQRVAIARALINDPFVIIADEPTSNVDLETGIKLIKLLLELNRKKGVTIIISTHDPVIAEQADRIVKIRNGQIAVS
jgi:putative ABC transport system ATP-binding protein